MMWLGIASILFGCLVHIAGGAPLLNTKNTLHTTEQNVTKRFFKNSVTQPQKYVKGQVRDFMNEVIGHTLHGHREQPDRWMDFYNNDASWDRYMSPQLHHHSHMQVHDPHYDVSLSFPNNYEETDRVAASQAHHIEAYPGEIVSGENSLSKFIAPPVFDNPSEDRDNINEEQKKFLHTPEGEETEEQNTRQLVDSLKSLMKPLRAPQDALHANGDAREFEHLKEDTNAKEYSHGRDDTQSSYNDENRVSSQNEAENNHFDFDYYGDRSEGLAKSRENLARTETNDRSFSQDSPEKVAGDYEDKNYNGKDYGEGGRGLDDYMSNRGNRFAEFKSDNDMPEKGYDRFEQFHNNRNNENDGFGDSSLRNNRYENEYDNNDHYHNNEEPENRDRLDNQDNIDNYESRFRSDNRHENTDESDSSDNSVSRGAEKPKPIEMVQDDSGRIKPVQGNGDMKPKHILHSEKPTENSKSSKASHENPVKRNKKISLQIQAKN